MPGTLRCTIVTPEREVLDEQVSYASIPAYDGQVGIAHNRAPLLAKLGYGPLRLTLASGGERVLFVGGGFAQVKNNELSVLTDEATPADEIDRGEADAALREAQAYTPHNEADAKRRDRDLDRARARARVAR